MRRTWTRALGAPIAVAALALAGCGGGGGEETIGARTSPRAIVGAANLRDIHSGEFEITSLSTINGETLDMLFDGRFRKLGEADLPLFQVSSNSLTRLNGRSGEFNGRLFFQSDGAVLVFGPAFREQSFAPKPVALKKLKMKVEEAQREGGQGDIAACIEAAQGVHLPQLLRNLKSEGRSEGNDGTPLFSVAGDIDLSHVTAAIMQLAEDPDCGAQMQAIGLPAVAELDAVSALVQGQKDEARATLAVDRRGVLRDLTVYVKLPAPKFELRFHWALRSVNQPVEIYSLSGSEKHRPVDALLRKFGTDLDAATQANGREVVLGFLEGLGAGLGGRVS